MEEASRKEGQDEGERREVEDGSEKGKENSADGADKDNSVTDTGSKGSQEGLGESGSTSTTETDKDTAEHQREGEEEGSKNLAEGDEEGNKDTEHAEKETEKEKDTNNDSAQGEKEKETTEDTEQGQKETDKEKEVDKDMPQVEKTNCENEAGQKDSHEDSEGSKETTGQESAKDTAGEESSKDTAGEESSKDTAGQESSKDTAGQESSKDTAGQESSKDTAGQEEPMDTEPSAKDSVEPMECEDENSVSGNKLNDSNNEAQADEANSINMNDMTKDNLDDTSNQEKACTSDPFAEDSNKETEKQDSGENGEKQPETSTDAESASQKETEKPKEKDKDDDEIIELEVVKKPAELVDLAEDEEGADKTDNTDDNNKGIKLRPFASLLGNENQETNGESGTAESTVSPPIAPTDSLAIGEILEHGHIIGSAEIGGLQLRISNVIGGEDCITGLSAVEDSDTFSNIQIASVTTLMDPSSPEDPNKDSTEDQPSDQNTSETQTDAATDMDTQDEGGIKIVNSESLAGKTTEDGDKDDSTGQKIQLSSAVSEVAKDATTAEDAPDPENVYQIVKSVLTVSRICHICTKAAVCEYRVKKKKNTFTFICTQDCKAKWIESLPSDHTIEKARIIFEKLCGMCGKDLSTLVRKQQFSWETREFCSQNCLTLHLNEVAGECHSCHAKVGCLFIGKYCVRFGSDIHQFCSNACLEFYKGKIKVCCYCQKNLQEVTKVMSTSNKEYCSSKCLKRTQRRDIGQQNYNEKLKCTVCQGINVNRYEFLLNGDPHMLCSEPCLNVYKYVNKVKAVACCLCFRVLNAEEVGHYLFHGGHQLRVFCSDSCVNVFILSARKIVVCDSCKVKKYNFDMIHKQIDDEYKVCYYCSLNCLQNADSINKGITAGNATATNNFLKSANALPDQNVTTCNMCSKAAKAQYHMVMSDNTLRSFCCYDCASKFKKNFGFIVDGVQQSVNSGQLLIRPKPTAQLTNNVSQSDETIAKKNAANEANQLALKATAADLLQLLTPPQMVNKMTSCKPTTCTKGVYCKPHPWHKSTQTDESEKLEALGINTKDLPPILPVPMPLYVPSPMMMYNAPFPVPIFVPVPLPVPIFIPTTGKTSMEIARMMKKIRDEMPSDPYEAEMLLLARQHQEEEAEKNREEQKQEGDEETAKLDAAELQNNSGNFDAEEIEDGFFPFQEDLVHEEDDLLHQADISCLDSVEEDLPRYTLRVPETSDGSMNESTEERNKRTLPQSSGRPSKRVRRSSNGSPMTSDPDDPEEVEHMMEPALEPDTVLEEELPYLNKMYGLAAWKRWVTGKNAELAGVSSSRSMKLVPEDLLTMNCDELNYSLCLFLKDLRKPNGNNYQPDTVFYLLLGIQQHLFESQRTDCIFMDFGFEKFTNTLEEITKTFLDSLPSPDSSPSLGLGVTRITESMLWECRQLGAHTPQVLLNTLFYFNTKVFKLRTVQEHMSMSFVQIVKQWRRSSYGDEGNVTRTSLLKYYPKKSQMDGGPHPEPKTGSKYEMHENREDPLRCPVKLYEFYLSKCPESVRNQRNVYYVYPERSCVPDSPVWFSMQAVQHNNISKMLHRALMVREVQEALVE